jgi:hypothetical protein
MESTEKRELTPFHSVDFRGVGRLILQGGDEQSVEVTAEQSLLPRIRTEVRGGVLIIAVRWWFGMLLRLWDLRSLQVHVRLKELRRLNLSGAGTVESDGRLSFEELDLRLSGAGRISLELQSRRVLVGLSGAGSIELSGQTEELELRLSGAGSIEAEGLASKRARVRSSGAGQCRLQVAETLEASLSGVGSVQYRGSPRVESRISGIGRLEALP